MRRDWLRSWYGLSPRHDLRQVAKRTRLAGVELAGRRLRTAHEALDVSGGVDANQARAAFERLSAAGVAALCVAQEVAPDDGRNERAVAELARDAGGPVCRSSALTDLDGLELRAVSAALNA